MLQTKLDAFEQVNLVRNMKLGFQTRIYLTKIMTTANDFRSYEHHFKQLLVWLKFCFMSGAKAEVRLIFNSSEEKLNFNEE